MIKREKFKPTRKEFEPTEESYVGLVLEWQKHLREIANHTLKTAEPDEVDRADLEGAIRSLGYVDQLVKILQKLPYEHDRIYTLQCLWNAITAGFVVGSRGVSNPVLEKLTAKKMRDGKRTDEFDNIVKYERDSLWKRKPSFKNNRSGTAGEIQAAVNRRLRESEVGEKTQNAIIHSLKRIENVLAD
jgi:hypothetical protein